MATKLARKIRGTRLNLGKVLKERYLKSTDIEFEPLVFGDFKEGDKFIPMPTPGDNSGHGGFLNGSYLFIKTYPLVYEGSNKNAVRLCDGGGVHFCDTQWVIKIE